MPLPAAMTISALLTAAGQPIPNVRADSPRVLVMPFENVARDSRIVWLGEAAALLITEDLNALDAGAFTREQRVQAFERLQVPLAAALSDATVIRIGQLIGASQVVTGSVRLDGETLVVRARTLALDTGRVQADVTERGPTGELFATLDRIARGIGVRGAAGPAPPHPSLAAFEQYVKGVLAETPPTAVKYLTAAIERQPEYDRARLALWDAYTDQGEFGRALAAVQPVKPASALARRAQFRAGLSQLALKQYDDAFDTFRKLDEARSTPAVLNNLGVVQLRRGATPQTGLPAYYFQKASEADPADPDYCFNLGYAAWLEKDTQAVIYWLRETVRRDPADGDAHFVLGAALSAVGNASEAAREKELARRLSSTYDQWDRRPAADPVPRGLERVKPDVELPHEQSLEGTLTSTEQRDQQELARFYLDRGRRLFEKENDRDALVELNRALYLSPYQPDAHLLVGRIHLRSGRVHEAIAAFKIALWSTETAAAHIWLGEAYLQARDPAAARAEAERALTLAPDSADARALLAKTIGKP